MLEALGWCSWVVAEMVKVEPRGEGLLVMEGVPFGEHLFSEVTAMRCQALSTTALKELEPTACGWKPKSKLLFQGGTYFRCLLH